MVGTLCVGSDSLKNVKVLRGYFELYVMMNDSYKTIAHPTFLTWKPHATTRKEPILVEDSWRSALPCMGARPRTQVGGLQEFNNIGVGKLVCNLHLLPIVCWGLGYRPRV